ncbi:hypothetical protein GF373_07145 [bacterium]|nr:hypothetical protein [bacterium]
MAQTSDPDGQGIEVYTENPFYWQLNGTPTLLLGASSNDNLFQSPQVVEEINLLHSIGGNYLRCTMSSRDEGDVWPYKKNEDGQYDLQQSNPQYWERFDNFLSLTASKDIVVQVELWATYDFYKDYWDANPYNPKNNVNYNADSSKLPEAHQYNGWEKVNPFFHSVPVLENNRLLLDMQKKFVDKIFEISFPYQHVLYSIDNETNAPPEWGRYWAKYLKDKAENKGKNLFVTEMWDNWDPTGGKVPGIRKIQTLDDHPHLYRSTALNTINHPELYNFIDISNNNGQIDQVHYETGLWVRNHVAEQNMIRPINNVKIYGGPRDQDWCRDNIEGKERFWRNIFAGHAAVRFHRPPTGIGINQEAQNQIKSAKMIEKKVDFFTLVPATNLIANREDNEAYCLSNPKNEYVLYFPTQGEIILNASQGKYKKQILHLEKATWGSSKSVELPGSITTDTDKPCVVLLIKK